MEMKQFESEFVKLARKHNLTVAQVKKIYSHQFKLIMDAVRQDYNKPIEQRRSIKVRGLGTFEFNPYLAQKLEQLKKEKNDTDEIHAETNPED
jgi:hypothetical protein